MRQILRTTGQVGQILTARRKALKLSQADLAKQLNITQGRFSALELDTARLTLARLLYLVDALGLELVVQDKGSSEPPKQSEW